MLGSTFMLEASMHHETREKQDNPQNFRLGKGLKKTVHSSFVESNGQAHHVLFTCGTSKHYSIGQIMMCWGVMRDHQSSSAHHN